MPANAAHPKIELAIKDFAQAYGALEQLQGSDSDPSDDAGRLLPAKGDQKTGLIGEYWAMRHARAVFPSATITFGGHSQKGWDLRIARPRAAVRYVQVKTVSDFGKGKLSPVTKPGSFEQAEEMKSGYWDDLWLLRLDRDFQPILLWKLKAEHVNFGKNGRLTGRTVRRDPDHKNSGSTCFTWHKAEVVRDLRSTFPPT